MELNQFGSHSSSSKSELIDKLNSLKEKLQSLQQIFSQAYQEMAQGIASIAQALSSESAAAFAAGEKEIVSFEGENLKQLIEEMERCKSQTEILNKLIKYLSALCQRVALFIISGDNCIGWLASGFGEGAGQGKKKITIPLNKEHIINHVYRNCTTYKGSPENQPDNISLLQTMGAITPPEIAGTPLIVKGKVAGVIYLDQGFSPKSISNIVEIEIGCRMAGMSIDLLPIKKQYPPPAKPPEPKAEKPSPVVPPIPTPKEWPTTFKEQAQAPPTIEPPPPLKAEAPPAVKKPSEEEQKLHEEAKRLARLLVSEIKLYNEAKLAIAREEKNIYQKLKEDIDRSRNMYEQRVPELVRTSTRYFDEELVRILANNDPSLLGI